jgi:pimeloyl-ACP methyl ester carboxylesterase
LTGSNSDRLGHWANEKAQREFTTLDDELRAEAVASLCEQAWSSAPDEFDVETSFGSTHVSRFSGSGVPLVLLHGAGATSLMWFPLLGHLVGRSVYAIDVVGEPGLSVQRRAIGSSDDLTAWLDEVFDGISVDRAYLVGASYGGWIALNYARRTPNRVGALVLVEPVLDRVRPWFWVHGLLVLTAFALPRSLARPALRHLHMGDELLDDKRVRRYGFLGLTRYRRGLPKSVTPVTDEELGEIDVATLLLLGENSEVHKSEAVARRVREANRNIKAEVVSGAGHGLPIDKPDEVAARLLSFIAERSAPS